jgi:putative ABC transport system permease protein
VTCPGYFATLGIPILAGRDFTHGDATHASGAVIVNERMAALYWAASDPVGRRLKLGSGADTPWLTVVGVVRDVRHFGLDDTPHPEIYRPYPQAAWPQMTITVKSATSPLGVAEPVRQAVRRLDRDQPVTGIRSMADVVDDSVGYRRFPMQLLSIFSTIALALAVVGVYGVVSYVVTQRSREIGIRMALGARATDVVRMVIVKSLAPIGAGLALGVAGSLLASRLLGALLYEVEPGDPLVLGSIALLLGGSAVVAAFMPARRAARVDPLVVLRQE